MGMSSRILRGSLLKNLGYAKPAGQFGKNQGDRNVNRCRRERLRRILRQSLPPQCRGRARTAGTTPRTPPIRRSSVRAACPVTRHPMSTIRRSTRGRARSDKQIIEDNGALTKAHGKRSLPKTLRRQRIHEKAKAAGNRSASRFNGTDMQPAQHVVRAFAAVTPMVTAYIDGAEADDTVGSMLKALDDLGIADNPSSVSSSDQWPSHEPWRTAP